jgi:hypothetical protein
MQVLINIPRAKEMDLTSSMIVLLMCHCSKEGKHTPLAYNTNVVKMPLQIIYQSDGASLKQ